MPPLWGGFFYVGFVSPVTARANKSLGVIPSTSQILNISFASSFLLLLVMSHNCCGVRFDFWATTLFLIPISFIAELIPSRTSNTFIAPFTEFFGSSIYYH
nr:MAG TPA: hypothetical protein [Caudoviricetes sp.]